MDEPRLRGRRYNWEEWFSKPSTTLYHDIDYSGNTTYFSASIRRAAIRWGYVVTVSPGEGQVTIVVHEKVTPKPSVFHNRYRRKK